MKITRRRAIASFMAVAAVPLLTHCAPGGGSSVVVGSKDFTEEQLLGEMYAQLLEHHGVAVHRRLGLGGTQVAMAALQRGSIDLYPEYDGTGLTVELQHAPVKNPSAAYRLVAEGYRRRFDLTWLNPAPMNNTQALAMTQAGAARLHIRTVSDLVAQAAHIRLAAVPEFLQRPDGLPGLEKVYGAVHFAQMHLVDSGLKYQALAHGDVDAVVAFSTDGRIASDHLLLLEDDRHLWQEYHPAPVIRDATLRARPQIAGILNPLAPTLTTTVMRALNAQVDGEKRDIADVATGHLRRTRLIT